MAQNIGIQLDSKNILKVWEWTQNDIQQLFAGFDLQNGTGPSSGYAIFLVSLFDIWGSIMLGAFGDETSGHSKRNIEKILNDLYQLSSANYPIKNPDGSFKEDLVTTLRHNLVHQYGLKHLSSGRTEQHLNIDITDSLPIINQQTNKRWHMNCLRLKDDFFTIIKTFLKQNNYL